MIIKKLKLKNIRSYDSLEVDFPEGSVLLSGDIGSGKTTILLAIEFALFGLQPGQKGSSLLKSGEKEGYISLDIDIEGKLVTIERTLKREKSISQDYTAITIDGEKKESTVTEIKNKILSLLSYPQEFAKKTNLLYRFTVYTPQEEMKQIILENSETRLNTLRHVFGIDKYKRIKENIELISAKLREDIRIKQSMILDLEEKKMRRQLKTQDVENLDISLGKIEKELVELKEKKMISEKFLEEIEVKIEEKKKYENEIEKTSVQLSGKKEMLTSLLRDHERLNRQIEESKNITFSESEILSLEKEKIEVQKNLDSINRKNLELMSQLSSLNLKNSESKKLKEKISGMNHCPTCLQDVGAVHKANITNKTDSEINESKKVIDHLSQEREKLVKEQEIAKRRQKEIEDRISELRLLKVRVENLNEKINRLKEMEKKQDSLEKDVEMLNKHSESLKAIRLAMTKYDAIYSEKEKELDTAVRNVNIAEINAARMKKEIELTKKEIDEIGLQIEKKEGIRGELKYVSELQDWLSTTFLDIVAFTERNVMTTLKDEFSKLFNEWFNILVPEIFTVHLDEDFTPVIEQQDYEMDYDFLSGGERTAIALAYRLALNQTINSLLSKIKTKDLVILDEPTDGFSEQQLDKMRDVLAQLKVTQLILVSHEAKIESFVENIIKFKKEAGASRVEK